MLDSEVRVTTGAADAILAERKGAELLKRIALAADELQLAAEAVEDTTDHLWSTSQYGTREHMTVSAINDLATAVLKFAAEVRAATEGVSPQ